MPKKKRGHGFTHTKRGRRVARGFIGRSPPKLQVSAIELPVLKIESSEISLNELYSCTEDTSESSHSGLQFSIENDNKQDTLSSETSAIALTTVDSTADACALEKTAADTLVLLKDVLHPFSWTPVQEQDAFHIIFTSSASKNIPPQREVHAPFDGMIELFVHSKRLSESVYQTVVKDLTYILHLQTSRDLYVDNVLKVVLAFRKFEICAGADHQLKFEELWHGDDSGYIDNNPFGECRYRTTYRSNHCALIVPVPCWRCEECWKCTNRFRSKMKRRKRIEVKSSTTIDLVDEEQNLTKTNESTVDCLIGRIDQVLDEEGVNIDGECAETLTNIFRAWGNLTPVQETIIQQQVKSSVYEGSSEKRWHPAMIRLALSIQSNSNAGHAANQVSGLMKLPGGRILSDYTQYVCRSGEVCDEKLFVSDIKESTVNEHEKYFCLLMEEICISQNLVFRKTDGFLVGYVNLDNVMVEITKLQSTINNEEETQFQPTIANRAVVYMVRECSTGENKLVAAFAISSLSREQLFSNTWEVISMCEAKGLKILAIVCDGSSVHRSFIAMHTPATPTEHGIVFDAFNLCALERKIYFICDPPNLLKTIRNCFAKSGTKDNCTRLLQMKNQLIEWRTIEKLYLEESNKTLRRPHKLNSQNVYLNRYSCTKVSYAEQVMSRAVALDLIDRNWPGTEATVNFILKVNDFFDCLHGSQVDFVRENDKCLEPYMDVNDTRFRELTEFDKYISDWQNEVYSLKGVPQFQKVKMTLSPQTVESIHITINGFIGAVKFLLGSGAKYVHGRTFCLSS